MSRAPLVRKNLIALFADKAPATIIGWIWKAVLLLTLQVLLIPGFLSRGGAEQSIREPRSVDRIPQDDATPESYKLMGSLLHSVSYFLIVSLSLSISGYAKRQGIEMTEAGRHKEALRMKVLAMGMALIPAWAFKDVVATFMDAMEGFLVPALLVLLFATAAAIMLPHADAGGGLCLRFAACMSGSMGLGVAFACNDIVKFVAGDHWQYLPFQLVYSPVVTLLMTLVRPRLLDLSGESSQQHFVVKRLAAFLASTTSFMVAWAWNALIARCFYLSWPPQAGDDLMINVVRCHTLAVVVTAAAAGMVAVLPAAHVGAHDLVHAAGEIAVLAAGVNVGSFWTDAAASIYEYAGRGYWQCCLLCATLTFVVPLVSVLFLFLIDHMIPPEAEPLGPTEAPDVETSLKGVAGVKETELGDTVSRRISQATDAEVSAAGGKDGDNG